jgi:hypothetical protein
VLGQQQGEGEGWIQAFVYHLCVWVFTCTGYPIRPMHFLRTFSSPSIFSILFLPIHNSSKLTRPDNSLSSMKRIRFAPRSIFFKFFNPLKPSIVLSLLFAKSVTQKFKEACHIMCKKWKSVRIVSIIKLPLDKEIVNLKNFPRGHQLLLNI